MIQPRSPQNPETPSPAQGNNKPSTGAGRRKPAGSAKRGESLEDARLQRDRALMQTLCALPDADQAHTTLLKVLFQRMRHMAALHAEVDTYPVAQDLLTEHDVDALEGLVALTREVALLDAADAAFRRLSA